MFLRREPASVKNHSDSVAQIPSTMNTTRCEFDVGSSHCPAGAQAQWTPQYPLSKSSSINYSERLAAQTDHGVIRDEPDSMFASDPTVTGATTLPRSFETTKRQQSASGTSHTTSAQRLRVQLQTRSGGGCAICASGGVERLSVATSLLAVLDPRRHSAIVGSRTIFAKAASLRHTFVFTLFFENLFSSTTISA